MEKLPKTDEQREAERAALEASYDAKFQSYMETEPAQMRALLDHFDEVIKEEQKIDETIKGVIAGIEAEHTGDESAEIKGEEPVPITQEVMESAVNSVKEVEDFLSWALEARRVLAEKVANLEAREQAKHEQQAA